MNPLISGILKIILLEASLALLLIDRLAGDRFPAARRAAFGVLAGLMLFAWANYGSLMGGGSVVYVASAVPLILGLWWFLRAGFSEEVSPRMQVFRRWLARLGRTLKLGGASLQRPVAVAIVVLATALWVHQGVRTHALPLVHSWEQFHFYLGAKYQKEVGYFDLYTAAIIADREGAEPLELTKTRDIHTFDEIPIGRALQQEARVRAKFSLERWQAFKADWEAMRRLWSIDWGKVLSDHGFSASPAWAIVAHPLASLVPLSRENQMYLGWIDMLLMLAMWFFVYATFGPKAAGVGLFFFAAPPIVFLYVSGSILRWDWLFATGMAACFLKRGRCALAGGFFGFAVATKLFPLFFGVGLAMQAAWTWWKTKKLPHYVRPFLKGTVIAGTAAVIVSSAMSGTHRVWLEYAERIKVAQLEKYYTNQYSLKTVYVQFAESSADELSDHLEHLFFPEQILQAYRWFDMADHRVGFLLVRLVFTALIFVLARRADPVGAFLLGPLLVFTWLTVNMYYWNMLGLLALGLALRRERTLLGMLLGLHVVFMAFYLFQHTNRGFAEPYLVSLLLCGLILGTAAFELNSQIAQARAGSAGGTPHT